MRTLSWQRILGTLFRRVILPFLKISSRILAGGAIKTGLKVANDVAQDALVKQATKRCIK